MSVKQLVNFDFPCSQRTSNMLIYDVLGHEIWFTVRSFRYTIWLRIRAINRASEGNNNKNSSSTTRDGTVAKPADRVIWAHVATRRHPGAQSKIDDRMDPISFQGFHPPFRLRTRGCASLWRKNTARRSAKNRWVGSSSASSLRNARSKTATCGSARYCARTDYCGGRWRRAMETSRDLRPGTPFERGPTTCRLIYDRASVRDERSGERR